MTALERFVKIAPAEDLRALAIEFALIPDERSMEIVVTELEARRIKDQEETKAAMDFERKRLKAKSGKE